MATVSLSWKLRAQKAEYRAEQLVAVLEDIAEPMKKIQADATPSSRPRLRPDAPLAAQQVREGYGVERESQ